ncbi:hypothetical protein PV371_23515 [Streptomyces sp. TX20-6-3]|uniref:hypothetical protein n=1 Tax=Streptomyces sp. TX20-6-3 TaxID=3028705 RepID=UPI0029B0D59E|nr:hypothetical protein [Streptomyces sp. TX20-6-3]MDX2562602.1 hypothetical protein [Streptomyces sp. TX20-6-3]
MRVTRRSARTAAVATAAVATGAVAALLLPAAGAFAADGPDRGPDPAPAPTSSDRSVLWRNVDLADGSLAKVYQDGPGRFSAEIYAGGSLIDTLTSTDGRPAYGQNNGLHVVLRPDGTVRSWVETAPRPDPQPKKTARPAGAEVALPDAKVTLPDGNVARLFKSTTWPRIELTRQNGRSLGSLDLKHPTAAHHGWTYKLVDAGGHRYELAAIDTPRQGAGSWVYDFQGRLVGKYVAQKA